MATYKEYNEKFRLPEQTRDEQLILEKKHFCLAYEPGKGKTYPAIHCILKINEMKGGNAKVLIMSDATCIRDMWKKEIVPQHILPKETYLVTDRTAIGQIKTLLENTKWDVILCDECQSLRSGVTRAKSKYAKLVYQLTKRTEYVIGMTGTINGAVEDIKQGDVSGIEPFCVLHNLNIAGLGNINCHSFKVNCCELKVQYGPFGAFEKPVALNKRGQEIMQKAYDEGCSFWDYDDNDEMPPLDIHEKTFIVPNTKTYDDAIEGIIQCNEYENTILKAVTIQKAQQALNGFIYYDPNSTGRLVYTIPDFVNPKLDFIVEKAKEGNCVIAYRFQEDADNICKALNKNNIPYTTDISEYKTETEQKNNTKIVLVLQCSRGKSANLQIGARRIIFFSCDYSFIRYKQLIHRGWRRGQKEPCEIWFLINEVENDKNHVERNIWRSIRTKQNIHETLMAIKRGD